MHPVTTHLKGTLHQEPSVNSEDLFLEKISIFGKCFKSISALFLQKNFEPRSPLGLNHPCLLTSTSAVKNYDG